MDPNERIIRLEDAVSLIVMFLGDRTGSLDATEKHASVMLQQIRDAIRSERAEG
jgi:hypothetical protein